MENYHATQSAPYTILTPQSKFRGGLDYFAEIKK